MKKILLGVSLLVVLVGCEAEVGETYTNNLESVEFIKLKDGTTLDMFKDNETGCQYLILDTNEGYGATGGLVPYYDKDGEVKGCGEMNQNESSGVNVE